jgi:hypothetical protein
LDHLVKGDFGGEFNKELLNDEQQVTLSQLQKEATKIGTDLAETDTSALETEPSHGGSGSKPILM